MEQTIDLKERSENNLDSQKVQTPSLSWWSVFAFVALFTITFSSTLFILKNSQGGGVFAQGDKNAQNAQNASVFDVPNPTDIQSSDNNIIPVKVILYKDPFVEIEIKAQAAYVFDVTTGKILYERNKNKRLPLASLTKIMTVYVATNIVGNNELVAISEKDIEKEGDSGLLLGEKWKLSDLLDFTLITSSNDGASAIASAAGAFSLREETAAGWQNPDPLVADELASSEPARPAGGQSNFSERDPKEAFIEKMNKQASTMNLTQMEFFNESGLDLSATKSGAYGTAQEVGTLFEYILKNNPELLEATTYDVLELNSQNNITHTAKNTNESVKSFPGLLASKTGYTNLAGGNLAVAFDSSIGTPIIIIVLGSTLEGRFEDIMKLYYASLEEVSQGVY